jgi:hypothetical protein
LARLIATAEPGFRLAFPREKRVSFGPIHAGVIWLSDVICLASVRM